MLERHTLANRRPLGRDASLDVLSRLLDHVTSDRAAVVTVRGESGQGRTTLLDWLAHEARCRGLDVLRTTGVELEQGLTYSGLTSIVRPLVGRIDQLPPGQSRALRGALGLEQATSPPPDLTAYAATLALITLAAETTPVVVVVDDAQWLDRASLEALVFAAHRCDVDRVGFVFAQRSDLPCLLDQTQFARLELEGLDREAAVALLADVAEEAGEAEVDASVARRCWALTGGNPLALLAGVRSLTPEQRAGEAPLPPVLPLDGRQLGAFGARLDVLPAPARRALGVAALEPDDDLGLVASALAELDGSLDDLAPAEDAEVVALDGGTVRWSHSLLRSAALSGLRGGSRRDAHRALALVSAKAGRDDRAAWHLAQSVTGPDDEVAAQLADAAATAFQRGALDVAATGFEQAARLSPVRYERDQRLLQAAEAHSTGGDFERTAALLRPAIEQAEDPVTRGRMALTLGLAELWLTGAPTAIRLLETNARTVDGLAPDLSAVLLLHASVVRLMTLDTRGAQAAADAAAAAAGRTEHRPVLAAAQAVQALMVFFGGGAQGSGHEVVPIAQVTGSDLDDLGDDLIAVTLMCAHAQVARGELAGAIDLLQRVIDRGDVTGMVGRSIFARIMLSDVLWRVGRWPESLAQLSQLRSLQHATGRLHLVACASAMLARVEAGLGQDDECHHHATEAVETSSRLGITELTASALSALGLLDLGAGRFAEAAATFDRLAGIDHMTEPGWLWWQADAVEAYLGCDRLLDAQAGLARLEDQAAVTGRAWARAAADRCGGLLGVGGSPDDRLSAAVAGFQGLGAPFDEARSLLARGELRQRSGQEAAGARDVAAARAIFDRLGARAWSARASTLRGELSGDGASLASLLTQAELRVAMTVGLGASNRQAADELYISVKTVDYHLQRIYRKLGLRNRAQLAAIVAAEAH